MDVDWHEFVVVENIDLFGDDEMTEPVVPGEEQPEEAKGIQE